MQRADFAGVFKAMDGLPVTIRLLDTPLHEFLPRREDLMVEIATLPHADAKEKKALVARYSDYGAKSVGDLKKLVAYAAGPGGAVARVQSHARTSRLPARHHLSRNHRDAGTRHFRGRS